MKLQTEILVVGCGVAGCAAALAAAREGREVLMITGTREITESNTSRAQGGIILSGEGDSAELLAQDIMTAGAGMSYPPAVEHLTRNGPSLVRKLLVEELDVPFDRTESGELDVTEEGAHSLPRIIHAEDLTGEAIMQGMLAAVEREKNITLTAGLLAVDLLNLPYHSANRLDIYKNACCLGVYALDQETGEMVTITAQETILATGGLGQLFLHTTNPPNARGDGLAMAYRAGARLTNLEYIQFHPTALYRRDANRFLISESLRGEGAVLINHKGETFMTRYHPQGSLAPRDVVARAIHNEIMESGHPCVFLDITQHDSEWLKHRFPHIYKTCLNHGVDLTTQPVPVVPAAHYLCGGIMVDLEGRSNVPRLRAVGEVACTGLHGANRLASTSLLEGLLWGWDSGKAAARLVRESPMTFPEIRPFIAETEATDPALIHQDWHTIKSTMWNYVGLSRTPRRLERAMVLLRELQHEILSFYRKSRPSDAILGLRNGITTALAVLFDVQRNHRSCGAHYIEDD